jgi:hypothetical protein
MTSDAGLDRRERDLHRLLIHELMATGAISGVPELARLLALSEGDLQSILAALADADYLAHDEMGRVTCLYPFSTSPTPHAVFIDGEPRFAMCAIDAIGVPAMLGQELKVAGRCAVCEAPISLQIRPGAIVNATPIEAMIVARRDESEPAFAACCPFTLFACGADHAEHLAKRIGGAQVLPLPAALARAEAIFGGLLAETLPAARPRGKRWDHIL